MNNYSIYFRIALLALFVGCKPNTTDHTSQVEVDVSTIGQHIEQLSSDDFMGRMPFTEGETKTVNYLQKEFEKIGLMPGNGSSYFQEVPLVEITGTPSEKMKISDGNTNFDLQYFEDFVALSSKTDSQVNLQNSELVFAGYGIVAPEYGWNDYEGIDWKGKTAVVLVNDPGFQSGDSTLFKGNEMTYYGRWTYKYEEAARQGAAGVLIIHETEPASYGWNVVQSSWSDAQLSLESAKPVADVQGWISNESAKRIFQASSVKNKNFKELAKTKDFRPISQHR